MAGEPAGGGIDDGLVTTGLRRVLDEKLVDGSSTLVTALGASPADGPGIARDAAATTSAVRAKATR